MSKSALESDHRLRHVAPFALVAVVIIAASLLLTRSQRTDTALSIDAYRGLASWVDIYDSGAWRNPDATVKDMASHGVRTVFVQTGNSTSKGAVFKPSAQESFIRAAHARGMKVVAWYLPSMENVDGDYSRIARAFRFRTSDGQRFDSLALDIESTAVSPEIARNQALSELSAKIRNLVGESYPLGGIIPSPVSLAKKAGHWDTFPYQSVAQTYDVILPMGYYTYDGRGAAVAKAATIDNVRILRAQPGCASVPIHLIGGLADKSTTADVRAFSSAARRSGCIGTSLYSWTGTTDADWKALGGVSR